MNSVLQLMDFSLKMMDFVYPEAGLTTRDSEQCQKSTISKALGTVYRHTLDYFMDFSLNMMGFILKMMDFYWKMTEFILKMINWLGTSLRRATSGAFQWNEKQQRMKWKTTKNEIKKRRRIKWKTKKNKIAPILSLCLGDFRVSVRTVSFSIQIYIFINVNYIVLTVVYFIYSILFHFLSDPMLAANNVMSAAKATGKVKWWILHWKWLKSILKNDDFCISNDGFCNLKMLDFVF